MICIIESPYSSSLICLIGINQYFQWRYYIFDICLYTPVLPIYTARINSKFYNTLLVVWVAEYHQVRNLYLLREHHLLLDQAVV
jgi:hypothetical protein